MSIYFLLLHLPDRAETSSLVLQGNPKWCKASFWALGMSPCTVIVREKLGQYIYNNRSTTINSSFSRNSTSPFTLSSKSDRGVTDKWKAYSPHCLASVSLKWLGNSTSECILVFLVLSTEAASQSTSNASRGHYIFDIFCLSLQRKVIVHWFVYIFLCQICNKPCHCNGVEMSPSFFSYKQLLP